jgi:hypothetical protein
MLFREPAQEGAWHAGRFGVTVVRSAASSGDHREGIVPSATLTWHAEESRFAFHQGEAAFVRNWPYPYALMQDSASSRGARERWGR